MSRGDPRHSDADAKRIEKSFSLFPRGQLQTLAPFGGQSRDVELAHIKREVPRGAEFPHESQIGTAFLSADPMLDMSGAEPERKLV